jgi:hypothetical protein
MPKPNYIICSLVGAYDEFTKSVSFFSLLEVLPVAEARADKEPSPESDIVIARVVMSWIREEGDGQDQMMEAQIVAIYPDGDEKVLAGFEPFSFSQPIHRHMVPFTMFPRPKKPGSLKLEGRLRRAGEPGWEWRQTYTIVFTEPSPPAPPKPVAAAGQPPSATPPPGTSV